MRVIIDMQGAQSESRYRGIGRYTRSLVRAMLETGKDHQFILLASALLPDTVDALRQDFSDLLPPEAIRVWHGPGPVRASQPGNDWRREAAECLREMYIASLEPDVVFVPSLFEGHVDDAVTSIGRYVGDIPTVTTVFDLIPLLNPDEYLARDPDFRAHYLRKVENLERATRLVGISESACHDAAVHLGRDPAEIVNAYLAADAVFREMDFPDAEAVSFRSRFGLAESFVLYTGGADQRKNLPGLVRNYARLPLGVRRQHQLVIAGRIPDGNRAQIEAQAQASGLGDSELVFTGFVSDEDLARLYNLCSLFVFPSWHEGFGLPALEAMSCGAPVIGADATSIPEVIESPEALFPPRSEIRMAARMLEILSDSAKADELRRRGLKRAADFSWRSTARTVLSVLSDAAGTGRPQYADREALQADTVNHIAEIEAGEPSSDDLSSVAECLRRNHPMERGPILYVDVSELCQRDAGTGIQRVTRSLLLELLEHPPAGFQVEPVYATRHAAGYRFARAFKATLPGQLAEGEDEPIEPVVGDRFLGLDLQHHVVEAQEEWLAGIRLMGVDVRFVVYDLLPVLLPQCFPHGARDGHERWLRGLSRFDGAVCISRTVAEELETWMTEQGLPADGHRFDIGHFHLGADLERSIPTRSLPDDAEDLIAELASRPSFLMVGTIEPRKGYALVLDAFEKLWEDGTSCNLVIVGREGWHVESLVARLADHPEAGKRLVWLAGISDEYLMRLYETCRCLIAASEGEGFGLPLIEAAQYGTPLIVRDIPVFREVAGEQAMYFESQADPEALAANISRWLALYEAGRHPRSVDMPWLSWRESAAQLIEAVQLGTASSVAGRPLERKEG